jgi:hypothetical protein
MKTRWEIWKIIEHYLVIFLILLFSEGAYAWHVIDNMP